MLRTNSRAKQRGVGLHCRSMSALGSRAAAARVLALGALCCANGCASRAISGPPPQAAPAVAEPSTPAARRFGSPYAYEWFIRAELLRASGELGPAIAAYRAALTSADDEPQVLARLASALDANREHAAARALLHEALQLDPQCADAWLVEAELAEQSGQFEAALQAYEQAERSEPGSARAPVALAGLLRTHGYPERAQAVLMRYAARTLPGTSGAYEAELRTALSTADPERVYRATLPYRLFEPPARSALTAAARFLLEHGRAARALRVMQLIADSPEQAELRLRVLIAAGSFAQLESWLSGHAPAEPRLRSLVARAELTLGATEAAASSVDAARLDQPDAPALQLLAADVALARGDFAAAARLYARVPSAAADYREARAGLAKALTAVGLAELAAELAEH
jgi:Tfp pilus assembly protein PilF